MADKILISYDDLALAQSQIQAERHILIVNIPLMQFLGDIKAVLINKISYWCDENRKNQLENGKKKIEHFHDGEWWMFAKIDKFLLMLGAESVVDEHGKTTYKNGRCSKRTLQSALSELEAAGIVISGNYNERGYDQTRWYRVDETRLKMLMAAWTKMGKPEQGTPEWNDIFCQDHIAISAPSIVQKLRDAGCENCHPNTIDNTIEETNRETGDAATATSGTFNANSQNTISTLQDKKAETKKATDRTNNSEKKPKKSPPPPPSISDEDIMLAYKLYEAHSTHDPKQAAAVKNLTGMMTNRDRFNSFNAALKRQYLEAAKALVGLGIAPDDFVGYMKYRWNLISSLPNPIFPSIGNFAQAERAQSFLDSRAAKGVAGEDGRSEDAKFIQDFLGTDEAW